MGTLENKGVELNFAFIPYQNTAKSAYWTISVNGSHNTDKLKKISEALRHMNEENYNEQGDSPLPHYEEGESINRIWAVKSLGIDPMTGEEILLKRNGKMTGEYDVWIWSLVVRQSRNGKEISIPLLLTRDLVWT